MGIRRETTVELETQRTVRQKPPPFLWLTSISIS
jgi:hypothetical protein